MQTLEERIQRLEDIEAIKQLKARYLHACDRKDTKVISACFKEGEVLIDYGPIGQFNHRDELINVFREMAVNTAVIDAHHAQNPQIKWLSATVAEATWDLYFFQLNPETKQMSQISGYYKDKYEKLNGEWLITETRFKPTSTVMGTYQKGSVDIALAGETPSF